MIFNMISNNKITLISYFSLIKQNITIINFKWTQARVIVIKLKMPFQQPIWSSGSVNKWMHHSCVLFRFTLQLAENKKTALRTVYCLHFLSATPNSLKFNFFYKACKSLFLSILYTRLISSVET